MAGMYIVGVLMVKEGFDGGELPCPAGGLNAALRHSLVRTSHPVVGQVGEEVENLRLGDGAQKGHVNVPDVDGVQIGVHGHLIAHELQEPQEHPQIQIVFVDGQRRLAFDVFVVS